MSVRPTLALVLAELAHVYAYRMNSLGKHPQIVRSAAAAHAQALRTTRSYYPGFTPNCI